ncbi:MAG: nuclear transport factor 2 family protein [Acidimicrobiales bacterium]
MTTTPDDIAALEDRRWKALIDADLETLRSLFADELSYTHSNGLVDTKASYLEAIEKGTFDYRSETRTETDIRIVGSTAMVIGRCAFHVVAGGRDVNLDSRYSIIWVDQDGAWKALCYQSTPLPS